MAVIALPATLLPATRRPGSARTAAAAGAGRDRGLFGLRRRIIAAASPDGDSRGSRGGLDPSLELAVPFEQRPVNELAALKQSWLFGWALLPTGEYLQRLVRRVQAALGAFFFALPSAPIAAVTFDPARQPLEFALAGAGGALLVVTLAVTRIYLGWSYVGNRLLSAAIEYEETGWYDGQIWTKPPEVLARDRLLGTYEVRPTLGRLKATLLAAAAGVVAGGAALAVLVSNGADEDGFYGRGAAVKGYNAAPRITASGLVYRNRSPNTLAEAEQMASLQDLLESDEAAAEEAAAQGDRPGYCGDRLYRARAGGMGSVCESFE